MLLPSWWCCKNNVFFIIIIWETLLVALNSVRPHNTETHSVDAATRYQSHSNASPVPVRLKTDHFSGTSTSNMNKLP